MKTVTKRTMAALCAASFGCGPGYVAQQRPPALAMSGSVYIKEGKTYSRDLFMSNLPKLVENDDVALSYAKAARAYQISGLVVDLAGLITGALGVFIAARSSENLNDIGAQVLLNASLTTTLLGPILHVRASDRELDSVNAFNDRHPAPPTRPAASANRNCGFGCLSF